MAFSIRSDRLSAKISSYGGCVSSLWFQRVDGEQIPVLRPTTQSNPEPENSAAFPLVPFGNRIADNSFSFEGKTYEFTPNSADPLYIHGDGWKRIWDKKHQSENALTLAFHHQADDKNPYDYTAEQQFVLEAGRFKLVLSVTNQGDRALPFGLGWHPYFFLKPGSSLQFNADSYHDELEGHLPGRERILAGELDFRYPRPLPERWLNNGYSGVESPVHIFSPDHGIEIELRFAPIFSHAFLYLPWTDGQMPDFFCFEPMSHKANGHNLPNLGGLRVLKPTETLSGTIELNVKPVPISSRNENSQ